MFHGFDFDATMLRIASMKGFQRSPEGGEIFKDAAKLDEVGAFRTLLKGHPELAVDRAGVHPGINLQERHADIAEVALRQCPKASVCIPILGADAGVKCKRALPREGKDFRPEQRLAAGDQNVRGCGGKEISGLRAVRTCDNLLHGGCGKRRIYREQAVEQRRFLRAVACAKADAGVDSEGKNIQQTEDARPAQFVADSFPQSLSFFTQHEDAFDFAERSQPAHQSFAIKERIFMANERGLHAWVPFLRATAAAQ